MESFNQVEQQGFKIITDILASSDPKKINTILEKKQAKVSGMLKENFHLESAEKFLASRNMYSSYTENYGKKDDQDFTSLASFAVQTKIRKLESLDLARILKKESVLKISQSVDSNLTNFHFTAILDFLRALYAVFKIRVTKSEVQSNFKNPDVFKT